MAVASSPLLYGRMATLYDVLYGLGLQHGRRIALRQLALQAQQQVLEVGIGTGLSALHYPASCRVTAIDISPDMLRRARSRLQRHRIGHVALSRMDAGHLAFADATFDVVYAPYVINTLQHPIVAAKEMRRVCKQNGRIVFLNHFHIEGQKPGVMDRTIGRVASALCGVSWAVELRSFLDGSGLEAASVQTVNFPAVSTVVTCLNV